MNTNPQSEVKCCEKCRETEIYLCSGKCECHYPKESPVSQSVEGWEKESTAIPNDSWEEGFCANMIAFEEMTPENEKALARPRMILNLVRNLQSTTLSTLVKKMEWEKQLFREEYECSGCGECEACLITNDDEVRDFNAGISAAVEVVKKMV